MAGELDRIRMSYCGPKLSLEEIRRFESTVNLSFDTQYVDFLLKFNGGHVYPLSFRINTTDAIDNRWADMTGFYPLIIDQNDTISRYNLLQAIERQNSYGPSEGLNPPHSIPIASVIDTDDLLLFVDGEHKGEVWVKLWHMCDDEDFPNPWSYCYKVGNDLFDFLGKLEEGPD